MGALPPNFCGRHRALQPQLSPIKYTGLKFQSYAVQRQYRVMGEYTPSAQGALWIRRRGRRGFFLGLVGPLSSSTPPSPPVPRRRRRLWSRRCPHVAPSSILEYPAGVVGAVGLRRGAVGLAKPGPDRLIGGRSGAVRDGSLVGSRCKVMLLPLVSAGAPSACFCRHRRAIVGACRHSWWGRRGRGAVRGLARVMAGW